MSYGIFNPYYPIQLDAVNPITLDDTGTTCSKMWQTSSYQWMASVPVAIKTIIGNDIIAISGAGPPIKTTYTESAWLKASYTQPFPWAPEVPCCASCTVFGGKVKVCKYSLDPRTYITSSHYQKRHDQRCSFATYTSIRYID